MPSEPEPKATRTPATAVRAAVFDRICDRCDGSFPREDGQIEPGTWLAKAVRRRLTDAGCLVTGIDISPVMLDLARRRAEISTALGMVEADLDDVPIPFLGVPIRVTGYLRDELRELVIAAGFSVLEERNLPYVPASTQVPPAVQLFLHCRRNDA